MFTKFIVSDLFVLYILETIVKLLSKTVLYDVLLIIISLLNNGLTKVYSHTALELITDSNPQVYDELTLDSIILLKFNLEIKFDPYFVN
jgi:hypothetical protein